MLVTLRLPRQASWYFYVGTGEKNPWSSTCNFVKITMDLVRDNVWLLDGNIISDHKIFPWLRAEENVCVRVVVLENTAHEATFTHHVSKEKHTPVLDLAVQHFGLAIDHCPRPCIGSATLCLGVVLDVAHT